MSDPELKFEVDEHGRIKCRVTNEGVLLSKDEKEFIIDHITRMQAENAKLRELVRHMWGWLTAPSVSGAALHDISGQMHELRIEVKP